MSAPITSSDARTLKQLVGLIAALLAVQVLALVVGGLVTAHWVHDVEKALGASDPDVTGRLANIDAALEEITRRQAVLSEQLMHTAATGLTESRALRERRKKLDPLARGPIDKTEQMIQLMQLMADEQIVLIDLMGGATKAMGKSLKPLDAQKGVGGAGVPAGAP